MSLLDFSAPGPVGGARLTIDQAEQAAAELAAVAGDTRYPASERAAALEAAAEELAAHGIALGIPAALELAPAVDRAVAAAHRLAAALTDPGYADRPELEHLEDQRRAQVAHAAAEHRATVWGTAARALRRSELGLARREPPAPPSSSSKRPAPPRS